MKIPEDEMKQIEEYAHALHKEVEMTHNLEHVSKVVEIGLEIAEKIGARKDIVKAAALLHDIGYSRLRTKDEFIREDHAKISTEMAKEFLIKIGLQAAIVSDVCECIYHHSSSRSKETRLIESYCLHDADKIDCLGFDGALRMLAWDLTIEDNFISISEHIAKLKRTAQYKEDVLITEEAKEIARKKNEAFFAVIRSLDS